MGMLHSSVDAVDYRRKETGLKKAGFGRTTGNSEVIFISHNRIRQPRSEQPKPEDIWVTKPKSQKLVSKNAENAGSAR